MLIATTAATVTEGNVDGAEVLQELPSIEYVKGKICRVFLLDRDILNFLLEELFGHSLVAVVKKTGNKLPHLFMTKTQYTPFP